MLQPPFYFPSKIRMLWVIRFQSTLQSAYLFLFVIKYFWCSFRTIYLIASPDVNKNKWVAETTSSRSETWRLRPSANKADTSNESTSKVWVKFIFWNLMKLLQSNKGRLSLDHFCGLQFTFIIRKMAVERAKHCGLGGPFIHTPGSQTAAPSDKKPLGPQSRYKSLTPGIEGKRAQLSASTNES